MAINTIDLRIILIATVQRPQQALDVL